MFKIGDKVRCTSGKEDLTQGNIYVVAGFWGRDEPYVIDDAGDERFAQKPWFELVNEGPVREVTVTRREIVEGQYGGIYVAPDGPGQVTLGFDGHYVTFNAEQLAELEHLSAQLREALTDA